MDHGRIIVLSGASGTGKTTLARRLQERLGKGWLYLEADEFVPSFAPDAGPDDGAGQTAFVRAMVDAALQWPTHGFDIILDGILPFPESDEDALYTECVRRMREVGALLIGVTAAPKDVTRRIEERGRGDVEWSLHQLAELSRLGPADAWIDTSASQSQVAEAVDTVVGMVDPSSGGSC
jgi:chloramphenicol 3-O-phosphotransferase